MTFSNPETIWNLVKFKRKNRFNVYYTIIIENYYLTINSILREKTRANERFRA